MQSWNHLWGLFLLQFTCTNSRCSNWTETDYVSEWPTLQVNIVMVIKYRMLLKLRPVAHYCSTCFLSSGYIAVFIIPSTWAFYLTSVLIGIGAASEPLFFTEIIIILFLYVYTSMQIILIVFWQIRANSSCFPVSGVLFIFNYSPQLYRADLKPGYNV